jgi:hypothetical protein
MKPSPFAHPPRRVTRALACAAVALAAAACGLALASAPARAQAPGVPAGPAPLGPVAGPAAPGPAQPAAGRAPGGRFWRFAFFTLDQWSFTNHPYAQITEDSAFDNGRGAGGSSLSFGAAVSDADEPFPTQLLHSLPPFSVEVGRPLTVFLPKAISFGLDFYAFSQRDVAAGKGTGTVPPIRTDTYLYQFDVRAFAFDPTAPGLNYYIGIGVGTLQGKLTATPFQGQPSTIISYGQDLTGATLVGIEAKGESVGMRYELAVLGASQVKLNSNPYPGTGLTTIDFSGTITRLAVFYQF